MLAELVTENATWNLKKLANWRSKQHIGIVIDWSIVYLPVLYVIWIVVKKYAAFWI